METDRLIEFRVVAEELNFRRAAHILAMSQSSLSRHIDDLERHLGFELLLRDRHKVFLTPEGQRFLDQLGDLPERLDQAIAEARRCSSSRGTEVVRVGYGRVRGLELIEQVMRALEDSPRPVTLELVQGGSNELVGALERGHIDLAFVRPPVSATGITHIALVEETIGAVLRSDHPLACEDFVSGEAFGSMPFVTLRRRAKDLRRDNLDAKLHWIDLIQPEMIVEADSMTSLFLLLEAGRGVGLVREAVFRRSSTSGLVMRPLVPPVPGVPLHLAWDRKGLGTAERHVVDAVLAARSTLDTGYRMLSGSIPI